MYVVLSLKFHDCPSLGKYADIRFYPRKIEIAWQNVEYL